MIFSKLLSRNADISLKIWISNKMVWWTFAGLDEILIDLTTFSNQIFIEFSVAYKYILKFHGGGSIVEM